MRCARLAAVIALAAALGSSCDRAPRVPAAVLGLERHGGVLVDAGAIDDTFLARHAAADHASVVVLALTGADRPREEAAAARVLDRGFRLFYWIEVARAPDLAAAHPDWVATVQGHPEWRRLFPSAREPKDGEIVRAHPWVPILYEEAWTAQLARVKRLLAGMPRASGIFLNDLQGAPSACGCGNLQCRWTVDYGPLSTATRGGADSAARFVAAVQELDPLALVIPVWTTECEQDDGAADGKCAGVGCYGGQCWRAWSEQLEPLARDRPLIAVLAPFRAFGRDGAGDGVPGSWVHSAVRAFSTQPARFGRPPVDATRMIAVIQGWGVSEEERRAQIAQVERAGAGGWIVAEWEIQQGWEARVGMGE